MKVSIYPNAFDLNGYEVPLSSILKGIKNGRWKHLIEELRSIGDPELKSKFKDSKLPAFTVSGTFPSDTRVENSLVLHSGIIGADVDYDEPHFEHVFKEDPYTFCAFRSASGKGWCVLVKIPVCPDKETHKNYGRALHTYYMQKYSIELDPTFKNLNRLRYISYDPNMFGNRDSQVFNEQEEAKKPNLDTQNIGALSGFPEEIRLQRMLFTFEEAYGKFSSAKSRHEYVYSFFVWTNRAGISHTVALDYALQNFPIQERNYTAEHKRSCNHVYTEGSAEFATKLPREYYTKEDVSKWPQHKKRIFSWLINRRIEQLDSYVRKGGVSQNYVDSLSNEIEVMVEISKLI